MNKKIIQYGKRAFLNFFKLKQQQSKPQILSYLITNLCNSHCITCNIWKEREGKTIELNDLKATLDKELFSEIRHVGISGGEPSIFPDLKYHIKEILNSLPNIKSVSITSNSIQPDFWINNLEPIFGTCKEKNVYFQINLSLDGVGEVHNKVRGTNGNFESFEKVLSLVREKQIPYQIHTTINRYNVYHVNAILGYAKSKNADIIFRLASEISRLSNKRVIERISLDKKQISFFCDFINSESLLNYTRSIGRKLYYKHLANQLLKTGKRSAPCYFQKEGVVLSSDKNLFYCSRFETPFSEIYDIDLSKSFFNDRLRNNCISENCSSCYHDQTGFWSFSEVLGQLFGKKLLPVRKAYYVSKNLFLANRLIDKQRDFNEVTNVGIVGMYGGEHVGDAAILGGVIWRLKNRYPHLGKVSVYSFRKDRTECWADNLTQLSDIEIKVYDNNQSFVKELKGTQILVWAGGPMMELPLVMTQNYYFIRKALSFGCKIEIEGIGYGPLNSFFGKYMSKKILKAASAVTARSEKDKNAISRVLSNDKIENLGDPAFNYLSLLPDELNLQQEEKRTIDRLLNQRNGRKLVAVNLRPLWGRYGNDKSFDFDNFLNEIILSLSELIKRNYFVVFFPMNSDQFGFSDLDVANEIASRLSKPESFQIWETEPTIAGLIHFLRHSDLAICMRFHAAIFALSQKIMTIGLDYSLSGKGKVSTLFDKEELCLNIKDFKSEEILNLVGYLND
ncbi:polysaccharide pyruvyl transferase family protein [Prevotella sp. 10(H)]|uniref:polysaccharide pyruvyl transferase family protein n=1 Tax=Prevotella sp. 10(H) TaxID=1158294 RepID=UPI0004A6CAD4|nr:polysaccharide pyruvyl transferase family protein [Prevotella sp. 10(H)]